MIRSWTDLPWFRLAAIFRYSTLPTIHRESVAEHTCFVALNSYAIALDLRRRGFKIDIEQVLRSAVVHDIDEALTGDFIRTFKYSDAELTRTIKEATRKLMVSLPLPPETLADWNEAKAWTLEGQVVHFSDLWSLCQFATREIRLGSEFGRELLSRGEEVLKETKWMPEIITYVTELRELCREELVR